MAVVRNPDHYVDNKLFLVFTIKKLDIIDYIETLKLQKMDQNIETDKLVWIFFKIWKKKEF